MPNFYKRLLFLLTNDIKHLNTDSCTFLMSDKRSHKKLLRKIPHNLRLKVYKKSNGKCPYCNIKLNNKNRSIDHIIPYDQVKEHKLNNLITCCKQCNSLKANLDIVSYKISKDFFNYQIKISKQKGNDFVKGRKFKRNYVMTKITLKEKEFLNNSINYIELVKYTQKLLKDVQYFGNIRFHEEVYKKIKDTNPNKFESFKKITNNCFISYKTNINQFIKEMNYSTKELVC